MIQVKDIVDAIEKKSEIIAEQAKIQQLMENDKRNFILKLIKLQNTVPSGKDSLHKTQNIVRPKLGEDL